MPRRRYEDDDDGRDEAPRRHAGSAFASGFGATCGVAAALLFVAAATLFVCCGLGGLGVVGSARYQEAQDEAARPPAAGRPPALPPR